MFYKIIDFVLKNKGYFIVTIVLLTLTSSYLIVNNLKIDNSLSIWFLEDDKDYKQYIQFQEEQGSNEIIIAMIPVNNVLKNESVTLLSELHNEIDSLIYVVNTISLANARYPIYGNGKINYRRIYNEKRSEKSLINLLKKLPTLKNQLIAKDNKHLLFYVQLKPTQQIEKFRRKAVFEIKSIIQKKIDKSFYYTGPPVLNEAYNDTVYNESIFFAVLTVIIILILLFFLLPDINYVIIAFLSIIIPVSLVLGLLTVLGYQLNMISMILPTILTVYSVSDVVHIINFYDKQKPENSNLSKNERIKTALQKSLKPCFYTTLTTIVGYVALYFSPLPAFKVMSIFATVGLVLAFILVYLITCIGFSFLTEKQPINNKKNSFNTKINLEPFLIKTNDFTTNYKKSILVFGLLIFLIGIYLTPKIEVNTDSLNLLGNGKVKKDLQFIEKQINGSTWLQLDIISKTNNSLLSNSDLLKLKKFQKKLEENKLVSSPVSILNFKSFLEKRSPQLFQFGSKKNKTQDILLQSKNDNNSFFSLFSDDFTRLSVTISAKELQTKEIEKLITLIKKDFLNTFKKEDYKLKIQGFSAVFAKLNRFILQTQFYSFSIAFIISFIVLFIFIGNFKRSILALIPNLLPLAILVIIMYFLKIPLEVSTVMIVPIMLGITMDDTIHLIYNYNNSRKKTGINQMDNAVLYTGKALFSTTIALVFGFLIIGFSGVVSIRNFGLLCTLTIAMALIADVVFLPALFKTFVKK
jgi:predicted RND superfamily exporter protein